MDKIVLGHGSGGLLSRDLVGELFVKHFSNPALNLLEDSAELAVSTSRIAFTTDGYVVSPAQFPGGDIGRLAICGTVNDLAVKGAVPKWIAASCILEEGLDLALLESIVVSMKKAADEAGVLIVTGDTKVVERGKTDKIFITTSGVGEIPNGVALSPANILPGDVIIVSGNLAEHGVTVMNARHNLGLTSDIKSDAAPLNGLVSAMLRVGAGEIRAMRDLTRGGLCASLNEMAVSSSCDMEVDENFIPVLPQARAACALLGLDPVSVANEGKLVCFVSPSLADKVLSAMKSHHYGKAAAVVGTVTQRGKGSVSMKTAAGSSRILRLPLGEQLPRIC